MHTMQTFSLEYNKSLRMFIRALKIKISVPSFSECVLPKSSSNLVSQRLLTCKNLNSSTNCNNYCCI